MWGPWSPQGEQCYNLCLVDPNFKNLPAGDVVDKVLKEWGRHNKEVVATTDAEGFVNLSLLHGDFGVTLQHQKNSQSFKVDARYSGQTIKIIA